MKVLVTGGTGFIGSHAVAALARHDHDVRLLARTPARVAPILEPHGVEVEIVQGDVTDPTSVAAAIDGCDAVIHAAAEIPLSSGSSNVNVVGSRTVIGEAVSRGLDPIVYTSTVTVFLPTSEPIVTPSSDLATPLSAYGASKQEAELFVRALQADGAPVTSFLLGGVYGPTSPHLQGSFHAVISALDALMLTPPGGTGIVDVRDAAELLARAVEPGRGPRRYLAGGQYLSWTDWTDLLSEAAGVDVRRQDVSVQQMVDLGRDFDDQRQRGQVVDIPLSEEVALIMTGYVPTDDSLTLQDLDMSYRPLLETLRDTVEYLRSIGRVPDPEVPPVSPGPPGREST
jgi:nucleoside-diphosphate-sugar epimerase